MTRPEVKNFERHKADQLLKLLAINAAFDRLGKEGSEADIVYKLEEELGMEVVTAYHDNYQAKIQWGLNRGRIKMSKEGIGLFKDIKHNPDEEMLKSLQNEINKKCNKSIAGKYNARSWLCVFENSPLSDEEAVRFFRKNIKISKNNFEKIYLLHLSPINEGGGYKT